MKEKQAVRFNPYNPREETAVSKRNLPHWEQPCGCYFITFRLGDSLPQRIVCELRTERQKWLASHPKPWGEKERAEYGQRFTKSEEEWLEESYDRLIRDKKELTAFRKNILSNPSKAGLPENEFSVEMNDRLICH